MNYVKVVPTSTRVVAITGSEDRNTFPALARDYIAALTAVGVRATYIQVPEAGHEWRQLLFRAARGALASMQ